tara:strand:+ start:763 stop:2142 length:1380 start_codon:yes stop_codon:yes gene_type:complete
MYANSNINDFQFDIDSLRFISSNNKNLTLIFDKSIYYLNEKDLEVKDITIIDGEINKAFNFLNFEILKDSIGENYFVRKNIGEVFNFHNNKFNRIDKSSHIKASSNSFKIYHKGHILSFFGKDEFNSFNHVLEFNKNSKKWNKIIPSIESDIPPPRTNPYFKKINDNVYYFGGKTYDETKRQSLLYLSDYYVYNITNKKHTKIGELVSSDFRKSTNGSFIDVDDFSSLFFTHRHVYLIDFKNFNFERQTINSIFGFDNSQFNSLLVVKFKNKIYYLKDNNSSGLYDLQSVDLSKIIALFKNPSPLLLNKKIDSNLSLILLISFGLIIGLFVFYRLFKLKSFKNQNILKQSNYLTFNQNIVPLSFEESQIMDFLISNLKVKLSDIFELECFIEYSNSYRKVYIPKLLCALGDKFKILEQNNTNLLKLEKSKNKYDKRIIEYQLKGNIELYKGWLNYIFRF